MGNTAGKVDVGDSKGIKQTKKRNTPPPVTTRPTLQQVSPQRITYRDELMINERELYPQRRPNMSSQMNEREMMYSQQQQQMDGRRRNRMEVGESLQNRIFERDIDIMNSRNQYHQHQEYTQMRPVIQNRRDDIYEENRRDRRPTQPIQQIQQVQHRTPPVLDVIRHENMNIRFTPMNFYDEIEEYKKQQEDERIRFEEEEKKRREEFHERMNRKSEHLQREISKFEQRYNPFEILQLPDNHYHLSDIKKAYKRLALKYHPDKAGPEYQEHFQIITQAYIYLLNKCEEEKEQSEKMTRKVKKKDYVDDINEDGVENIYIQKDKFDIHKFNEIFEKYHMGDEEYDKGYGELYKQRDEEVGNQTSDIFGTNFNKEIFNQHFDEIKRNRKNHTDMIEYQEPEALVSSTSTFRELGRGHLEDYSGNGMTNLQYTDYKRAHLDDTLLIDPNSVSRKEYRNLDQLKSDREQISYTASREDTLRYQTYENMRRENERKRLEKLREEDDRRKAQYERINRKLIVHKKEE